MKSFRNTLLLLFSSILLFTICAEGQTIEPVSFPAYHYDKPINGVLRMLSYNVRNGKGMDEKIDYNRIAAVIRNIHPEVVALQELDSVTSRSNGIDVLKVLAQKCGMKSVYGASIPYQGGKYGIGILSKVTPLSTSFIPLPGREEKRGLLMAEFESYIFFCSHFSLTQADRLASVQLINKKVTELHKRAFLAGDLNATPESEEINLLTEHWVSLSGPQPTIPSSEPKKCIDYIWGINCCNFTYKIIRQEVVPEKVASDHRPVFVDISFNK